MGRQRKEYLDFPGRLKESSCIRMCFASREIRGFLGSGKSIYAKTQTSERVVCFWEIKTILVVRTYSESLILKNHCPDDNRIEGENLCIVV